MRDFHHITVLKQELVDMVLGRPDGIYVDMTLGGGGHSEELLGRSDALHVIGIDQDDRALAAASERLAIYGDRFTAVKGNFRDIKAIIGGQAVSGIMADLGVSSPQLDEKERGFSFMKEAKLDMRMDRSAPKTAYDVVNTYTEKELVDILFTYGEERYAKRIVSAILRHRAQAPVETTTQLADIVVSAIPGSGKWQGIHPATRTFQAIRIEVNDELGALKQAVYDGFELLESGGKMAFISFHSLEERIVKQAFTDFSTGCTCPKEFPVCVCGRKPRGSKVTKKPVCPGDYEQTENPRARSAKLRGIIKN